MTTLIYTYGGVAHLGERLNGIQEVVSSILIVSTIKLQLCRSELFSSTAVFLSIIKLITEFEVKIMSKAWKFPYLLGYYLLLTAIVHVFKSIIIPLLLKVTRLTVQGPTQFTDSIETVGYYIIFGLASFLLYRRFAKKNPNVNYGSLFVFVCLIIVAHLISVYFGSWATALKISPNGWQISELFSKGRAFVPNSGILKTLYDLSLVSDDPSVTTLLLRDLLLLVTSGSGFLSVRKS